MRTRSVQLAMCMLALPFVMVLIVAGVCPKSPAGTDGNSENLMEIRKAVGGLKAKDAHAREVAAKALQETRKDTIRTLMRIVSPEANDVTVPATGPAFLRDHDSQYWAIWLLGEYRASEAIAILVANIERYYDADQPFHSGDDDLAYPAAVALVKIGMPAVDPVIERLGIYAGQEEGRKVCAAVVRRILGPSCAKLRVEMAEKDALRTRA